MLTASLVVWKDPALEAGACIEILLIVPLLFSDAQLLAPLRMLTGLGVAMALLLLIVLGMSFQGLPRVDYDARMLFAGYLPVLGNAANFLVYRCMVLLFFCAK
jgi:hypothetical protein